MVVLGISGLPFRRTPLKSRNTELGTEARVDKRLVLTKTTNVIFRVQNTDSPVEYTIGIEKATE